MRETIFALATGQIKSGVAIIRISGDTAYEAIELMTGFKNKKDLKSPFNNPRKAIFCKLLSISSNEIIDEVLVIYFSNPDSFTGEDIVEFHIHGSLAVIDEAISNLALIDNFRLAEAGEFSRRAFENGKMDLTEAEGLSDLIEAETKMQLRQAIRQKEGILGRLCNDWRNSLISILASIEAFIDFPDEDIPNNLRDQLNDKVTNLKLDILKYLNSSNIGEKLRSGIYIAIIGSVNSGKSSLINYLAKRDVAIVSDIEGTTRDIIELQMDIDGYSVTIADTAGIRTSKSDLIEMEGIRRALEKANKADYKVIMFDIAKFPKVNEDILNLVDKESLVIINKIDSVGIKDNKQILDEKKFSKESQLILNKLTKFDHIYTSIKDSIGMDLVLDKLSSFVQKNFNHTENTVITRKRHRLLFQEAVDLLNEFSLDKPIELSCEDLRLASRTLGKVTGVIDTEEVLDNLFSNFCIGK